METEPLSGLTNVEPRPNVHDGDVSDDAAFRHEWQQHQKRTLVCYCVVWSFVYLDGSVYIHGHVHNAVDSKTCKLI